MNKFIDTILNIVVVYVFTLALILITVVFLGLIFHIGPLKLY